MGFLHESEPMTWQQAMEQLRFVREHGLEQFRSVFSQCQHIDGDPFRWGDEVEHGIFRLVADGPEDAGRTVRVALRSPEVLAELQEAEECRKPGCGDTANWMPEFGRWMIESTPGKPMSGLEGVLDIESNMRTRRSRLLGALHPGEIAPTVTFMPLFGTPDFCDPPLEAGGPAAESLFVSDDVIFPHPRFPTLTRNIRERRGGKVAIRRPLMIDESTRAPSQVGPDIVPATREEADGLDHVYADAMAFGMGACCLQVTMQASNLPESLRLYDQLAPLTPLFLALTAATPFLRGWICDDDTRWSQIAQSTDDRTPAERGLAPAEGGDARLAGSGARRLLKSRYDSIDCYLSTEAARFNDLPLAADEEHVDRLTSSGVPEGLARHVAHLFARDPLVIFEDRLHLDDERDVDHWENLQSTNWQTLRWKPPPPAKGILDKADPSHIGWRVEFRSMEVQLTDFENAAFVAIIVLLSKAILTLDLDLRVPISKIEENMATAKGRGACSEGRFWFRTNVSGGGGRADEEAPCALMTIGEILNGGAGFEGLLPLCRQHLEASGCSPSLRVTLEKYMGFIGRRADGGLPTAASWMRSFVLGHPAYRRDSRVPAAAAHDLMAAAAKIGEGRLACPELFGDIVVPLVLPAHQCSECGCNCSCDTRSTLSLASFSAASFEEQVEDVQGPAFKGCMRPSCACCAAQLAASEGPREDDKVPLQIA